ncbi:MAG: primosomal protein N' [Bacteroidota bacterium]
MKTAEPDIFSNPTDKEMLFADVIVPLALPRTYTWMIPSSFKKNIQPGVRVEVELRKKRYAGIVKSIHHNKPEAFDPKEIINVLDTDPILHQAQLQLWSWISAYYMCSEGEVMAAALPAHFKLSSESVLIFNEEAGDDFTALDEEEYLVAEALQIRKELKLPEVQQILDMSHVYPVVKRLIDKQICYVWESLKETYIIKKETYVTLNPVYLPEDKLSSLLNNWGRAPKQMELLLAYLHLQKTEGDVIKSALLKKSGASDAQLKGLVEKEILQIDKRAVDRLKSLPLKVDIDFTLSPKQQDALDQIHDNLQHHTVCLLHGVTGSGKTQIYIKLIEEAIKNGKQALYLLPEIALTAQIIRRLQKHFGGYIGIYHSKFSQNERVEIWNNIKTGKLRVVLGARSALFLPFKELCLIICDEEHDPSYKQQQPAPRYHARDAAIYYASLLKAKVVLGSGTPSIESYFQATNNKYGLVELQERFGAGALPELALIDTRPLYKQLREKVVVSPLLHEAVQQSIDAGRQVILFQNRRGHTPHHVCSACGWVPHCRHCDVSLTFHKFKNKLQCHYCGTVYPVMHTCEACGSHDFEKFNFGTERVEEQLQELFPQARIARMDYDTVSGKTAHDQLIQQFEEHKIDILVGTQMVVKGLDFEQVNLVGILDADSLLNFGGFRVNERAFQLMEQVSGRAGRKDADGKVLVQVGQTNHPVLKFVKTHSYPDFYDFELAGRKQFDYPPYTRLIHIVCKHKDKSIVSEAIHFLYKGLSKNYQRYLVGPSEPVVNRVRNQYLMELLLKLPRDRKLIEECKQYLQQLEVNMHQQNHLKSVIILFDVDAL